MAWIVIVFAYLAIILCLIIFITPNLIRGIMDFFCVGSRLYLVGLMRLAIGIMLLLLAAQSRFWAYVVIMGLIIAGAGLSLFFFALRRTKKILLRLRNQPNLILRIYAIIGLLLWGLLAYALLPAVAALPLD